MQFARWVVFISCLFSFSLAQAKDLKVGTVDLQKLFTEFPGTKKAQDKFNELAKKKQKDLADFKQELTDLDKDLRKSSSVLTEKQRKDKQYMLQKKAEDYDRQQNEVLTELKGQENEMTQEILSQIKTVVATVAKEKGVDLVLDGEKAVYVRDGIDLTDSILKSYKTLDLDSKDDTDSKK
jgi:outer membrane protein